MKKYIRKTTKRIIKDLDRESFYVISLRGDFDETLKNVTEAREKYKGGESVSNIEKFVLKKYLKLMKDALECERKDKRSRRIIRENNMIQLVKGEFNYPNYYVNKEGKIFNIRSGKFVETHTRMKLGYISVYVTNNGHAARPYLHRVLATLFVPNPRNKPQINHKNMIKDDNRIENLEWVTAQENQLHWRKENPEALQRNKDATSEARKNGKGGPKRRITDDQIREVRNKPEGTKAMDHFNRMATLTGFHPSYIQKIYYKHQHPAVI